MYVQININIPWPRALTQNYVMCGTRCYGNSADARWPRVDPVTWCDSEGRQGTAGQSRPSSAMAKSTKRIAFCTDHLSALPLPWLRFFHDFSSVVRQMPGYKKQSRGTLRTPLPQARWLHLSAWQMSRNPCFRQSQSGLGTQTANQPKFIPPTVSPWQPRP